MGQALGQPRDRAAENPLRTWVLRRPQPETRDPLAIAAPALDAMFRIADGLVEPLQLHAEIGWFDLEDREFYGYASPMEWRLERRVQPPDREWDVWPVPETLERVDAVDRPAADRFLAPACDRPPRADGMIACPALLVFSAVRVRLFEPVAEDLDRLVLRRDAGLASVAIEREARGDWVSGPSDGFVTAPVDIRAKLDRWPSEVEVVAYWTPWSEEDRPGTRAVEEAVARVAASGWELDE
jgi:hypothetical protein